MRNIVGSLRFLQPRFRGPFAVAVAVVVALGLWFASLPNSLGQKIGRSGVSPTALAYEVPVRPPKAPPNVNEPLAPDAALKINAQRSNFEGIVEAAKGFVLPVSQLTPGAGLSAQECLTQAIYYEAAGQPLQGQRAVAQVILNRMRHPAYPKSICGVVYQGSDRATGCQFTFTCDGSLSRRPSRAGWEVASRIAKDALSGFVERSVGTATHYHAIYVVPYWSPSLQKLVTIGAHIFYRFPGFWGSRKALAGTYAGESQALPAVPGPGAAIASEDSAKALELAVAADRAGKVGLPRLDPIVAPAGALAVNPQEQLRADREKGSLLLDSNAGQVRLP